MIEPLTASPESIVAKNYAVIEQSPLSLPVAAAYTAALSSHPHLADIEILPMPDDSASPASARPSWKSESGHSQVFLHVGNLDKVFSMTKFAIDTVPGFAKRFAELYGIEEAQVTPQFKYVESFVHELGHADEYAKVASSPETFAIANQRAKASMPLGSAAVSRLIASGTPHHTWLHQNSAALLARTGASNVDEAIGMQHDAYRMLPSERRADLFAANVFAANPELLDLALKS